MKLQLPILLRKSLCFGFLLLAFSLNAQTVFFTEDFETDGTGSRYTADDQFIDGLDGTVEDFFGRIEDVAGTPRLVDLPCAGTSSADLDITNVFTSPNGSFYMGGEDMNDANDAGGCGTFNPGTPVRTVVFTGINVTGSSTITGRILVANGASSGCNTTASRWDQGDGLKVIYNLDAGGDIDVLCLSPTITCGTPSNSNEPLHTDDAGSSGGACSGDGTGGTFVNNTFSEYTFTIPSGGNSLDLTIWISSSAGDSEIAFDYIRLEALTPPMPVELTTFRARKDRSDVVLNWATEIEINNHFYSIEYSTDGENFTQIGRVEGAGDSNEPLSYDYKHRHPVSGINYYRLKQVDYDGTYSRSQIVSVEFEADQFEVAVSPNPFEETVDINLSKSFEENTLVEVYNVAGQVVYTTILERGIMQMTLDLSELSAGTYFIKAGNDQNTFMEKIIKTKN